MTEINSFEQKVIDDILERNKTSMMFVCKADWKTMNTMAARNGIIAFLFDQGWHEVEIAQKLRQEPGYVIRVVKTYQKQTREILTLKNKTC